MRLYNRGLNTFTGLAPSAFNQELEAPVCNPDRTGLNEENYRFSQLLLG